MDDVVIAVAGQGEQVRGGKGNWSGTDGKAPITRLEP